MATEADRRTRRAQRRTIFWAGVALLIALSLPIHMPHHASQTGGTVDIEHSHSPIPTVTTPPIVHILKFFFGLRHFFKIPLSLVYTILSTVLSVVVSSLLYVLQPFILAARIILGLFIITPYRIVVSLVQMLYPVYVFCGAACIIGAFVGLCASGLYSLLFHILFGSYNSGDQVTANTRWTGKREVQ